MIRIKVAGKINLSLKVFELVEGFHELDMVTASVNVFDVVTLSASNVTRCNLTEIIPIEKNTAFIASELFAERFKTKRVKIEIEKNIPEMAGLGGSSADASAVIFGMAKLFGIDDEGELIKLARKVGSDVPSMLLGGYLRVKGTGEKLHRLNSKTHFDILAVRKGAGNSSREVYDRFDKLKIKSENQNDALCSAIERGDKAAAIDLFENDLTKPAISLNSNILTTLSVMNNLSPKKSLLFGSGSAVGGIFDTEQASQAAFNACPKDFDFVKQMKTIPCGIFEV